MSSINAVSLRRAASSARTRSAAPETPPIPGEPAYPDDLASDTAVVSDTAAVEAMSGVSGSAASRAVRAGALLAGDVSAVIASIVLGWLAATSVRHVFDVGSHVSPAAMVNSLNLLSAFALPLAVLVLLSGVWGHYTRFKPVWSEMLDLVKAMAYAVAIGTFMLFAFKQHFSRLWFVAFWASLVVVVPLARTVVKRLLIASGRWYRPAVVVGTGANARASKAAIESDFFVGLRVVGFLDDDERAGSRSDEQACWTRDAERSLEQLEARYGRLEIICAPETSGGVRRLGEVVDSWSTRASRIYVSPPSQGLSLYGASLVSLFKHDSVLLLLQSNLNRRWSASVKRGFDIGVCLLAGVLLSPLLLVLTLLVARDGGSVFYSSARIGRGGREFGCLKFRTMVTDSQERLRDHLANDPAAREEYETTFKLRDDPRITRVGAFLRRSSLDELPQLLNVLRGEMSLVGPRPILPEERDSYGRSLRLYESSRPGITGLWQVSGRSDLAYPDRVRLNAWYVRNWSLWTDIVILLKTIPAALRGSGAV